ncbi:MAG: N-acetyltransferase, partial [Candidatus Omnitrophica bacterium]|nr:N-acetyltransferase [Candidatus Omnitrophota bacterium]
MLIEKIIVRRETEKDRSVINEVNGLAFKQPNEGYLIEALRKTREFVPGLSLVAEFEGEVIGHILFYPIQVAGNGKEHAVLALAPVSVR